jgi:hypothetical protein
MVQLIAVMIILLWLATSLSAIGYHGWLSDERAYSVTITNESLANSPTWDTSAQHPPLSARTAIELATARKDALVKDSETYKWALQFAALMPGNPLMPGNDGKWYWRVDYRPVFQGGFACGHHGNLTVVVLMDGTVIEHEIRDASLSRNS